MTSVVMNLVAVERVAMELGAMELPDQITQPMTRTQAATLRSLSIEAYQPKQFAADLSRDEAEARIAALKAEIALADSF